MKCPNCGRDNLTTYKYFELRKYVCGICGYVNHRKEEEEKKKK